MGRQDNRKCTQDKLCFDPHNTNNGYKKIATHLKKSTSTPRTIIIKYKTHRAVPKKAG